LYSLSTELNPDWKSCFASQPEIRSYWESIFAKHKLDKYLVSGTNVKFARWDNTRQAYELTLEDVCTGKARSVYTEILVWAIGGFMNPVFPKNVPGMDVFKGHMWHSARWRHDVPLSRKRIGIIGNGCSRYYFSFCRREDLVLITCSFCWISAQIVPQLAKDPTVQIVNFCRTPQWYMNRVCAPYLFFFWKRNLFYAFIIESIRLSCSGQVDFQECAVRVALV
jgi:Flavin-binding monooxygenase-like